MKKSESRRLITSPRLDTRGRSSLKSLAQQRLTTLGFAHKNISDSRDSFSVHNVRIMAKKKQKKPKTVQDATTLSRINFLHQAAHVVLLPLQRHCLATSKVAQKKIMLKLDPKLKRLSCRRCSALLSPQSGNIKTRIINEKNDLLEIECRHCGTKRRFTISENFTLYSEKEPVEIAQIH